MPHDARKYQGTGVHWEVAASNTPEVPELIGRCKLKISKLVHSVRVFSRELTQIPKHSAPRRPTLGIALGGGFARGIAHIGALKVLEEENIPVDYVAGTSVGAIIGAGYCSGMTAAELADMARTLRFTDFARLTLSRYGFYNNDRMVRFFARVLKQHTFEDLKIPLAITATEFRTGEAVMFTKGPLVDPIRASCAYPGMFLPVEIDGRSYIDGMLAYAVPTTPLRHNGSRPGDWHLLERALEQRGSAAPCVRSHWTVLLDRAGEAVGFVEERRQPGD